MKYSIIKNVGISVAEYLFCSKTYHAHTLDTDIDLRIGDVFLYEKGYVRVIDRQVLFSDVIHCIVLLVEDVEQPQKADEPKKGGIKTTQTHDEWLLEEAQILFNNGIIQEKDGKYFLTCTAHILGAKCGGRGPLCDTIVEALVQGAETFNIDHNNLDCWCIDGCKGINNR